MQALKLQCKNGAQSLPAPTNTKPESQGTLAPAVGQQPGRTLTQRERPQVMTRSVALSLHKNLWSSDPPQTWNSAGSVALVPLISHPLSPSHRPLRRWQELCSPNMRVSSPLFLAWWSEVLTALRGHVPNTIISAMLCFCEGNRVSHTCLLPSPQPVFPRMLVSRPWQLAPKHRKFTGSPGRRPVLRTPLILCRGTWI